jgi:deoxyribonuclease IV
MAEDQHTTAPPALPYDAADEYRPEPPPPPEIPAWKDGSVRVGIHTSIAGDISGALEIAHGLGANALQIFSSSPRMWATDRDNLRITTADADRFRARRRELGLGPLVIHDNYLINLASPERVLRTRSVQAFHGELIRALALGADFLVAHPGSGRGADMSSAIAAIADGIRQAARGLKLAGLRILLENTAGQGSSVGAQFNELKEILNLCRDLPMGVCIDTAHLLAAGHDILTEAGLSQVITRIDATIGLANVYVIHVNDSKSPLGSHLDRHEHIGMGKIGLEAFARILNHPQIVGRAFILETPIDKPGDDRRNVSALWKLLGGPVPAGLGSKSWHKPRPHSSAKKKMKSRKPAAAAKRRSKPRARSKVRRSSK